jgi:2'-5' RNA ligase
VPDHALELGFDEVSQQAVLEQWEALREAGLPSQADHRSTTNAPHVTLAAATPIDRDLVGPAGELVLPHLPAPLTVRGLLVLGEGARVTVAHLVEPGPGLAAAVTRLRGLVPGLRHPVWTPHVTLARRLPRRRLPDALAALEERPVTRPLVADRLR